MAEARKSAGLPDAAMSSAVLSRVILFIASSVFGVFLRLGARIRRFVIWDQGRDAGR